MTKQELLNKFNIENENEIDANFYIDMKGIAVHLKIAKYLGYNIESSDECFDWIKVSSILRYDKRLRDKIYIYLAAFEEYLRSYISNKYEDSPIQSFWIEKINKKLNLKKESLNGKTLSEVLENIDFGTLIKQILQLPKDDITAIFLNEQYLSINLNAVRELRNAVSHHKFLIDYPFLDCYVKGIKGSNLKHNIMNLRQLLPTEYQYGINGKGGITAEINNCYKKNKKNQTWKNKNANIHLDDKIIIKI